MTTQSAIKLGASLPYYPLRNTFMAPATAIPAAAMALACSGTSVTPAADSTKASPLQVEDSDKRASM